MGRWIWLPQLSSGSASQNPSAAISLHRPRPCAADTCGFMACHSVASLASKSNETRCNSRPACFASAWPSAPVPALRSVFLQLAGDAPPGVDVDCTHKGCMDDSQTLHQKPERSDVYL